jgi:hypothetical protein
LLYIAAILFIAGIFFVLFDEALLAGVSFIVALAIGLGWFFKGTKKAVSETGSALTHGIREEVGKSEAEGPGLDVAAGGLSNAANLAGQQLFAKDTHRFKAKGPGTIAVTGSQSIMDWFKKVFK